MPKIDDKQWAQLVNALQGAVAEIAAGWTDHNSSDPGTTLVELLAFLAEDLAYRSIRFDERGKTAVERLIRAAEALHASPASDPDCGLRRVNYSFGQLLTVDDLNAEQSYFRSRLSRLNRALYGSGIVNGLDVSIDQSGGGGSVQVEPGLALDSLGNEIEVCRATSAALPRKHSTLFVLIRYREEPCDRVPTLVEGQDDTRASRIAESFELSLTSKHVEPWVPLARVRFGRKRWKVDREFRARRVKR